MITTRMGVNATDPQTWMEMRDPPLARGTYCMPCADNSTLAWQYHRGQQYSGAKHIDRQNTPYQLNISYLSTVGFGSARIFSGPIAHGTRCYHLNLGRWSAGRSSNAYSQRE